MDFDALVIIHPDRKNPKNPDYRSNLMARVNSFLSYEKPVFVVEQGMPIHDEAIACMLKGAERLGFGEDDQGTVNYIAARVGKEPESVRLAFGGLHAGACVYAYGTSWCRIFETGYDRGRPWPMVLNPIGFGKLLDDIV